jgi:serine/threonine protein kinase
VGNYFKVTGHETVDGRLIAGRYRLTGVIGAGGAGTVWTAVDDVLGREVAVKDVMVPSWLGDDERALTRERALREARAPCRIDHPNVVDVYDVVEQDGRPWIVMRLVKAPSLARVVEEDGPCAPSRAARIGLQVLGALRAAHQQGIMHRDVKPSNVLIDGEHAVLTDFGIATIDGEATLTAPDTLVGAPNYIAPERVRGEPATAASDLWSLGATLYAAVEGRPPHRREGLLAILTAVAIDEPEPPVRAGVLAPLLVALLRKDPAQRPNAAQTERFLLGVVSLTGSGDGTAGGDGTAVLDAGEDGTAVLDAGEDGMAFLNAAMAAETTTTGSPQRVDQHRTESVPAGRNRRVPALAGAAAVVLLAILLAGMLARPVLLPGVPGSQPPIELNGDPAPTSTIEPAEGPVQIRDLTRPDRPLQPPPAQPSPTQPSPTQPSPTQVPQTQPSVEPIAEPTQPPPTTQQPEPTPTGTPGPTPTPTSEPPPPSTAHESSASAAEIPGSA